VNVKKGQATRERIIEEATRLAAVRGLSSVSLADIAEPARLSKSGLFKHFESKEAMQHAVLASAFDRFVDFVWTTSTDLPKGRRRLEMVFERWMDWVVHENETGGCPINTMIMEFDDQPGPLRDYLRQRIFQWRLHLVGDFKAMRDPPVSDAEAWQAVFESKAFILGYSEVARLMEDRQARLWARKAFASVLDRLAGKG
jgi:AcrR family transcriptional regulator